jgi:hypothetical protein
MHLVHEDTKLEMAGGVTEIPQNCSRRPNNAEMVKRYFQASNLLHPSRNRCLNNFLTRWQDPSAHLSRHRASGSVWEASL